MRTGRMLALVLPLLLFGAIVAIRGRGGEAVASEPAGKLIDAPTQWVALSADFSSGKAEQSDDVVGRYFRSSDGSDRLESGPVGDAARVVFIRNVAQSRYYSRRLEKNGAVYWISGPMSLPPDGWKPKQMTELPGRRMLLNEKVEDRTVVQLASTGVVQLMAPSLNYLVLVKRDVVNGRREQYRNIQLGEPSGDLFLPPPGEEIRQTDKVEGIKWRQRPSAADDSTE